jgi:prepilin-type N-terminal cleavage/methylation domain-containing protein|tara:strand:+ start:38910 stop:39683 length:774 start_codon:yes stop_codon:yes gene_type:complete
MFSYFGKYKKVGRKKGFSLVELLVSMGVLVMITTLVLISHAQFSGNILIGNLAYDIALSVRQAQVFGLSVREFGTGSSEFDIGYGVHFDTGNNASYVLFADRDKDNIYDGSSELAELFTIGRGNTISQFCATLAAGTEKCSGSDITALDITFERPNPDAVIKSNIGADTYASAKITVRSPQGSTRSITVRSTGQISVEQTTQVVAQQSQEESTPTTGTPTAGTPTTGTPTTGTPTTGTPTTGTQTTGTPDDEEEDDD